LLEQS